MSAELEGWTRTGVDHVEPCGCTYEQRLEPGAEYHEGWPLVTRCASHREVAA